MKKLFKYKRTLPNSLHFSTSEPKKGILKTILYDVHKKNNAILKIHHGYYLPDEYQDDTPITSHLHTRSNCSLFDHTYKPILKISGEDKFNFLEKYVGSDLKGLWENECRISLLLNEQGKIIDDVLIIVRKDFLLMYISVQCKEKVYKYLNKKLLDHSKLKVKIEEYTSHSSICIQGSKSVNILNELLKGDINLEKYSFMSSVLTKLNDVDNCLLNRYTCTGEDGFNILIPKEKIQQIYKCILKDPLVKPAGLIVQNTLRLECGFCIYGKDINENVTPIEANYKWVLGKRRLKELDFNGAHIIMNQINNGAKIKRVGLIMDSTTVPMENAKIYSNDQPDTLEETKSNTNIPEQMNKQTNKQTQETIGHITSSCFSPVLQKPIAMAYVNIEHSIINNTIKVKCADKLETAKIVKMPFVPLSVYKI
ncbi:glycine cleavage system T protein, putative [Hepatocystis sp. ex Piliocolobus tephrosceles]|nr:glycine cleavage system T protein, putative [Hepatocystis sp. ex Piliocolobus tephrosceles]